MLRRAASRYRRLRRAGPHRPLSSRSNADKRPVCTKEYRDLVYNGKFEDAFRLYEKHVQNDECREILLQSQSWFEIARWFALCIVIIVNDEKKKKPRT